MGAAMIWRIVEIIKNTNEDCHCKLMFTTRQAALLYIKKRGDHEYCRYDVVGVEPYTFEDIKTMSNHNA